MSRPKLEKMQIGDLTKRTGVPAKTIRYYEDIGVLPEPDRAPNGYRSYDEGAVARLRFVRDAQATGLTLNEIASVLELREQGVSSCEHVAGLLEHHLDLLEKHIRTLQQTRRQLASLAQRARTLDPVDCSDPHRCQTIASQQETVGRLVPHHRGPQHHTH
jgi:DNA-binding transcriptional MerR regulator